ncbi:hypothetical protein CSB09_00255 [Candidatus Gracilibacteria bacterium]|nr:MAG: hypothetical protein CSB09_00255 [Candidatus Gracilibacteria bacterium]
MKNNLFIIDLYNLIYRMFYAVPQMHTRDGKPVNAIFGVAKFLKSLSQENPESCIIVASDSGKTFRSEIFEAYKGTRDRMPDDLRSQIETIFELFDAAHIPIITKKGYEADDIIGSLAQQTLDQKIDFKTIIISSDKDLCQFVCDEKVHIYDAMKKKFLKEKDIIEKFGVPKHQVRDYLAIVGDSSDNIPGIAGFGPKKAVALLDEFGSLEGIYKAIGIDNYNEDMEISDAIKEDNSSIKNIKSITPRMRSLLLENIDNAFLSQKLATIVTDLSIEVSCSFVGKNLETDTYIDILSSLDFRSLIPKEQQKEHKLPSIQAKKLNSYETFIESIHAIQNPTSISLDMKNKEFSFSSGEEVYTVSTRDIDIIPFFDILTEKNIPIIAYDIKKILGEIKRYKNQITLQSENQKSLF